MGAYKRTNPADVANLYVRNVLCDLSEAMGSFSEEELEKTLKFFNYKCPYTGEDLRELVERKKYELDHLIPQNRDGCGLHLYGNLVPISHDTNSKKSKKNFEDFIRNNTIGTKEEKEARIRKIKEFQEKSGFNKKFLPVEKKIRDYCKRKYQEVLDLLKISKSEICAEAGVKEICAGKSEKKGKQSFLFNGNVYTVMSRLALAVVKKYVEDHPGIDFKTLKNAFCLTLNFDRKSMIRRVAELTTSEKQHKRALFNPSDLITVKDAKDVCVNSQWQSSDMPQFIKIVKKIGYEITKS